jgi:transcriptional regulator with XRE-family HTH domain
MTRLKYERKQRRQSQYTLGKVVGLPQPALSQIERGILIPTRAQLERIAGALAVPPDELLKEVVIVTPAV